MSADMLTTRAVGCLAGAAVGDALGGATEGWESREIHDHYGGWVEGVVQSMRHRLGVVKPFSPFWKGDGHITDDTLMTRVLVAAYASKRDHLGAHDLEELVVPMLVDEPTWIPELDREDLLYHRLFLAEKWLVLKLRYGHADPRDAGVGNIVNCGAAMYIAPVGIANAGDPDAAYLEAIDLTAAHQSSYGREAAGVLAAAVAEAMRPGATPESVVAVAVRLAKDATSSAIEAVAEAGRSLDGWRDGGLAALRAAFAPFDSVGERYAAPAQNARTPSRLHAIEEVPVALGLLLATGGDYTETMLGGVNYGRDSDSIASMGGALAGALGSVVPPELVEEVGTASRLDLEEPGRDDGRDRRRDLRPRPGARRGARPGNGGARRGRRLRVTWIQPEDLVGHELRAAREEGKEVDEIERRWTGAGGRPAPSRGASQDTVSRELRALALELLDELEALPRPLAADEPEGFDEILAAADPVPALGAGSGTASPGPGSAAPRAACSGSRSRTSPARGSGRSPRAPATGPCAAGSRQRDWTRRWPSGGPGTARAARRALRRTSTASRRMTTSTSPCSAFSCSSGPGRSSTRWTWRSSGSTTCRSGGSSPPSGSRSGICSRPTSRPRPRRGGTRSGSGSARGFASTPTAGRRGATSRRPLGWPGDDARVSHTANGVYAAMWMAAAHAASLGVSTPGECAEAGLSVVPRRSRLAEALRTARELNGEWEEVVDELYARYGGLHGVHAINNTALVAAALYRFDDFSEAICAVVQGGWDTDTNGAAVGSILGALRPIEERWSAPLRGRFASSLPGFDGITLDELVARTRAVA